MPKHTVRFLPDNKEISIDKKDNLLAAATRAGISIKGPCGGNGACGQCKVMVKEGRVSSAQTGTLTQEELDKGFVLACQSFPETDLEIEVPEKSRLTEHQVLLDDDAASGAVLSENAAKEADYKHSPLFRKVFLELQEPSLDDNMDDFNRVLTALRKKTAYEVIRADLGIVKDLPKILRESNWQITVGISLCRGHVEITNIEPGRVTRECYGLAVDIGTTTVVANLVSLKTGKTIATKGAYNKQAVYGDDVITRIIYCDRHGIDDLQDAVLSTVNKLVSELTEENGIKNDEIWSAVYAANTTMTHMFLGIDPMYIRLEPYIPATNNFPPVRADELGISINPRAWVHCLPGISSYVGGDVTSGVLVTGMSCDDDLTLFIDIGTNGEMVLGSKEFLISCSCSAGPAFEGSGIKHGMRAMRGAIERIQVMPGGYTVQYSTINNAKPMGLCGSGLIDCLATLQEAGVIDRTGSFVQDLDTPRVRDNGKGKEFVITWAEESGKGEDITISEVDVKNLIRSKGAVYAGIRSMLSMVGLEMELIERVLIAGGFGRYINIRDAIRIGLLPDFDVEKYTYIGNSSIKGAKKVLLSTEARKQADEIASKMTYLELSIGNLFMDEFVKALFLPHTDMQLFPSLLEPKTD